MVTFKYVCFSAGRYSRCNTLKELCLRCICGLRPLPQRRYGGRSRGLDEKNNIIIDFFVIEVKGVLRKYDTPQAEFAV